MSEPQVDQSSGLGHLTKFPTEPLEKIQQALIGTLNLNDAVEFLGLLGAGQNRCQLL